MAQNNENENELKVKGNEDAYAVMLPCKPSEFRDFIVGLLGRPQTINKRIEGVFELNREDISSLYHLIDQRIRQQNDATLILFNAAVAFSDHSIVTFTSLEDLLAYNEIKAVSSDALHMSWTYLMRFQDRTAPQKQQIDVSFEAGLSIHVYDLGPFSDHFSSYRAFARHSPGSIQFRISHTARTWGADVEAMLSNYLDNILKKESKTVTFLRRNSGIIALTLGVLVMLGLLIGGVVAMNSFRLSQLDAARAAQKLNDKVVYVIDTMASGVWARFLFYLGIYLFVSLIVSIICGVWAGIAADTMPPSFILLSRQAAQNKTVVLNKNRKKIFSFVLATLMGITTSVIGSYIFAAITG